MLLGELIVFYFPRNLCFKKTLNSELTSLDNFVMKTFSPKGKKCNAGRTYGQISPKGDVKKCGGWSEGEDVFIGNIFDPNFKMLEKSSVCNCYKCVENEWAFLLDKEEQNK